MSAFVRVREYQIKKSQEFSIYMYKVENNTDKTFYFVISILSRYLSQVNSLFCLQIVVSVKGARSNVVDSLPYFDGQSLAEEGQI